VAGEPIEQMSDAAEEATSGQLVISAPALAAYLADREVQDKYDLGGHKLASGQYAHAPPLILTRTSSLVSAHAAPFRARPAGRAPAASCRWLSPQVPA
jgi:hypothetical protein